MALLILNLTYITAGEFRVRCAFSPHGKRFAEEMESIILCMHLLTQQQKNRTIEHIGFQYDCATFPERVVGGLIVDKKVQQFQWTEVCCNGTFFAHCCIENNLLLATWIFFYDLLFMKCQNVTLASGYGVHSHDLFSFILDHTRPDFDLLNIPFVSNIVIKQNYRQNHCIFPSDV